MKISIDIDGTLLAHQEFFKELIVAFKNAGHTVGILTGRGSDVHEWYKNLSQTNHFPEVDFVLATPLYNQDEIKMIGVEKNNEVIVGHFKARMIIENNINVHFDDNASYTRKWLKEWNADVPNHVVFTSPVASYIPS